jgi:NADPH-dependent F420 reductase
VILDAAALPDVSRLTVGILGGTGDQGRGLAYRLALAGQRVLIGSRTAERARKVAVDLGVGDIGGSENRLVALQADLAIVAVPWRSHADLLVSCREALVKKIVIDCVNPLDFDSEGLATAVRVPEGSAAEQARALLPASRVVAAFHHVSASRLNDPLVERIDQDVLVLGDDRDAVTVTQALASRIAGIRAVEGGPLRNAHQVESFTANLIFIKQRYQTHTGIRFTEL